MTEPSTENNSIPPKRGKHRIIIGAAPGVGKTYRMLQEAHTLKKAGIDVVIGYFEPHNRQETIALTDPIEMIPRRAYNYKGITLEDLDTQAIIKRSPHTVLIDELAHTNIPNSNNKKRYEDVEELLNAGINVVSTVNIQHIESLNDLVSRITGIQVNERLPDKIIDEAEEIVLVDIAVEELQERLKKGKVYPAEKIEQSLNNFFKKGNLVALRELALREVANNVEVQAEEDVLSCPIEPTGVHERILVCISSHPNAQRLIRRGYRIAHRLCAELIVLFVQLEGQPLNANELDSLKKHELLTHQLQGEYLQIKGHNIVETIIDEAKLRKITQIVIGETLREKGLFSFLKPAIPYQIFQRTENIDIYLTAAGRE